MAVTGSSDGSRAAAQTAALGGSTVVTGAGGRSLQPNGFQNGIAPTTANTGAGGRTPPRTSTSPYSAGDFANLNFGNYNAATAAAASSNSSASVWNAPPHPANNANPLPGVPGVYKNTWARGTMVRAIKTNFKGQPDYGFRFHYNPEQIAFQSPVAYNQAPAQEEGSVLFPQNFFTSLGSIGFRILLNRTDDMYANTQASLSVLGSKSLRDLGTVHDTEVLFRLINGDPPTPSGTADRGFIYPTIVNVRFSNAIKGSFFISAVNVTHIKFGVTMAPMVSFLDLQGTRVDTVDPTKIGNTPGLMPGQKDSNGNLL